MEEGKLVVCSASVGFFPSPGGRGAADCKGLISFSQPGRGREIESIGQALEEVSKECQSCQDCAFEAGMGRTMVHSVPPFGAGPT